MLDVRIGWSSSCVWAVDGLGSNWQHWCHQQPWWQARQRRAGSRRAEDEHWAGEPTANSTDQHPASVTPPLLVWNHFRTFKIQFSLSQNQCFKQSLFNSYVFRLTHSTEWKLKTAYGIFTFTTILTPKNTGDRRIWLINKRYLYEDTNMCGCEYIYLDS